MTQSDILLKHLSTVFDPELGANIVELGMVKKVDHEGSTVKIDLALTCLLYTSPSPRDAHESRMPSSA